MGVLFLQEMPFQSQVALLFISTILVGLPFGKIGQVLANWSQISGLRLYASYFSLASLVVLAWWLCPVVAFVISLAASMWHFADSDTMGRSGTLPVIDFIARGGMLLFATRCRPDGTAWILSHLVPDAAQSNLALGGLLCLASVHFLCLAASVIYHALKCHKRHHLETFIEQIALGVLFANL